MNPKTEALEAQFHQIGLEAAEKLMNVECSDVERFGGFMIIMGTIEEIAQQQLSSSRLVQELMEFGKGDLYE